jgi:hypothetical protein
MSAAARGNNDGVSGLQELALERSGRLVRRSAAAHGAHGAAPAHAVMLEALARKTMACK